MLLARQLQVTASERRIQIASKKRVSFVSAILFSFYFIGHVYRNTCAHISGWANWNSGLDFVPMKFSVRFYRRRLFRVDELFGNGSRICARFWCLIDRLTSVCFVGFDSNEWTCRLYCEKKIIRNRWIVLCIRIFLRLYKFTYF